MYYHNLLLKDYKFDQFTLNRTLVKSGNNMYQNNVYWDHSQYTTSRYVYSGHSTSDYNRFGGNRLNKHWYDI